MRTRITATLAAMLLAVGLLAAPAAAGGHGDGPPPPHGHVLLLHFNEVDNAPMGFTYSKCVDLANGQVIPVHHDTIHTGPAGKALRHNAGHRVVPTLSLPNCAALESVNPPTPRGNGR